jgi:hypothetical protein
MKFADTLDIILEDSSEITTMLGQADLLIDRLNNARRIISDTKYQLSVLKSQINADLAMRLRKAMPALNVGLNHGMCKVGYKTKHLLLTPDLEKGVWKVKSADTNFAQRFQKSKLRLLFMDQDTTLLINSIIEYFTNHYKSLGESLAGQGILLIENKISNLSDLVDYAAALKNAN